MKTNAFASKSRLALAGLVAAITLTGGVALAKPPRAKAPRGRAGVEKKVVKIGKAHIKPMTIKKATTKGTSPSSSPGSVQAQDPDVAFTLSANTPAVPYRGRLIGSYPREWRTDLEVLGAGGEIWVSQNQVPHGSYVVAELVVEAGHEYEVKLCTTSGTGEMVRATVGGVTTTFNSGDHACDVTLVLEPQQSGKTNIKIDFANEPSENGANAFALLAVEVERR